jgi:hypothetical protein
MHNSLPDKRVTCWTEILHLIFECKYLDGKARRVRTVAVRGDGFKAKLWHLGTQEWW